MKRARFLAFYLPQYYPIPENDRWWGPGFTEWTNVAAAEPSFRGHQQPQLPADLGFYDLRLPETRAAQAALARDHGIEAFCYYHYWFEGRRLLGRPFDEVLSSGEPDFPFCLAWANQAWTRSWLGSGEILCEQTYSHADDVDHARWLSDAFADPRYVMVGGRPVFLIYRPTDLPEPRRTTDTIRSESVRAGGKEPYLLGIDAFCPGRDCRDLGFDGTVSFEPQLSLLPEYLTSGPRMSKLVRNLRFGVASASLKIYDYRFHRDRSQERRRRQRHPVVPTVLVGWDNTPRRARDAIVMVNSDPAPFEAALSTAADLVAGEPDESRLVFVNAWNEWGEGNFLEPDLRWGRSKLEALQRVAKAAPPTT